MVKLLLSITYSLYRDLKEHLYYNGYHFIWDSMEEIEIDEDEVEYLKTILRDWGIGFYEV